MLQLGFVHKRHSWRASELKVNAAMATKGSYQQLLHRTQSLVDVHSTRHKPLLATDSQQLPCQGGGSLNGLDDSPDLRGLR